MVLGAVLFSVLFVTPNAWSQPADVCADLNTELVVPDLLGILTAVGVIDTNLCISQIPRFLVTNVVAILAVNIAGEQVVGDILTQLVCNAAGGCDGGTTDTDGDGISDPDDAFPNSIGVGGHVVIAGCDTGVTNVVLPDGATISDLIYQVALDSKNHGKFVSGVAALQNLLLKQRVLTPAQADAIQTCAGKARLP